MGKEFLKINEVILTEECLPTYTEDCKPFVDFIIKSHELKDSIVFYVVNAYKKEIKIITSTTDLALNRILGFIHLRVVEFSKSLYDKMKLSNINHVVELIECDPSGYLNCIEDLTFDKDIVRELLRSQKISWDIKYRIIEQYKQNIVLDADLKRIIAPNIGVSNLNKFANEVVCNCFGLITPVAVQCAIIVSYKFDVENSRIALKLMIDPYCKLADFNQCIRIPKTELTEKLLDRLKSIHIVTSYECDGFDFKVTTEDAFPF